MGYQFYNNWPYSNSVFPTMEDHVDPVNHVYMTGLHSELENIENELGLNPSGSYDTVKDRLNYLTTQIAIIPIRNYAINGNFSIWQRGANERPDLWDCIQVNGNTFEQESSTRVYGRYCARLQGVAGDFSAPTIMQQYIEHPAELKGKTVTASVYIRGSNQYGVNIRLGDNAGYNDSTPHTLDGTWTKITVTRNIGAGVTSVYFGLHTEWIKLASDIYVDGFSVVEGESPLDIFPHDDVTLMQCLRYYWKTDRFVSYLYGGNGDDVGYWLTLPVIMAGTPTITLSGGTLTNATTLGSDAAETNDHGFIIRFRITAAGVGYWTVNASNPGYIQAEVIEPAA